MQFQKFFIPLALLTVVAWSGYTYGVKGLLVTLGMVTMWMLLHWNRTMQVLRRASERPIGYVSR